MKKILLLSAIIGAMGLSSCDSYLDINEDPNSPSVSNIETSMLMPAIEMNAAWSYGDFLRIAGGYHSQIYAHQFGTSNYVDYSQFNMSATRSSGTYTQLNQRVLSNLKTLLEKAEADEDWGTYLAGTTLRAFTYQVLVDCYGEVPYTEALDESNLSPKFDEGQAVYEGIIAELDNALSKASNSSTVCTNFLFPGQTAAPWIKFANALKLRILMRMADVASVQSQLAALVAENNFPTSDVTYAGCWGSESGSMSPFYAEEFSTAWGSTQINVIANQAIIGTMVQKDSEGNITYQDPRVEAFFEPNASGDYRGGISGTNFSTSNQFKTTYWCRPVASYDMPVYMISVFETEFLLAEYYARYGSATEAEAHYRAAIEASFDQNGVDGADEYLALNPYDNSNYKKVLGVAKWVALAGSNPFEAWCEMRRLDYPAFGSKKGSDYYNIDTDALDVSAYVPGTLYTPIQVFGQVGDNKILERYPYAESSTSRNSNSPTFPGYTTPVFWGK
jgi:hypothetical protein